MLSVIYPCFTSKNTRRTHTNIDPARERERDPRQSEAHTMHDDVQRQIETKSEISRTKSSLVGVKLKQIEPRRCQIGTPTRSQRSQPEREGSSESGKGRRSFVGVRRGADLSRRSLLTGRMLSAGQRLGLLPSHREAARTSIDGRRQQLWPYQDSNCYTRHKFRTRTRVGSCRHGYSIDFRRVQVTQVVYD